MRRGCVAACSMLLVWAGAGTRPSMAYTLKTIAVDGEMSDWSAVLAEPLQHALDGPAGGLADLDAPVPSTGRDLTGFAWTYDSTYLYFYVGRVASDSNRQRFWFYIDANEDGRLQSGDPVVGVSWWGSTGRTDVELYAYRAASPAGDPLGSSAGMADGWDMPGSVQLSGGLESLHGGASSGVEMESRVAWASLGLAPGTPVRFHVASSNGTNLPSALHDNMAGPDGRVGSTRIPGVLLEPDRTGTVVPGGHAVFPHRLTNTGTSTDVFELSWSASGAFVPSGVVYHLDADRDGVLDASDPLLIDGDGDGAPDTGPLPSGAVVDLLAVVSAPAVAQDGQASDVTIWASSAASPSVSDSVIDRITVRTPAISLVKWVDRAIAAPDDVLTYRIEYTAAGSTDAHSVVVLDAVPPATAYIAGSASGSGTRIEFSHDGGTTFDTSDASPVTHIRWSLLAPLSPGGSGQVSFRATVR